VAEVKLSHVVIGVLLYTVLDWWVRRELDAHFGATKS